LAVLLDTSVLIADTEGVEEEAAISVVSLTEMHFGVLVAPDHESRARRVLRLASVESHFDAIPFDAPVARECGRLYAVVAQRGGQPRRRAFDLAIAATANVLGVALLIHDARDFTIIDDLVDVRPARS
jgi:predicted nucleic acid-binding protein